MKYKAHKRALGVPGAGGRQWYMPTLVTKGFFLLTAMETVDIWIIAVAF